jgi:hypothetical protein
MKAMYFFKIRETKTGLIRKRERLLTQQQAESFAKQVGKPQKGYLLLEFYEV